MALSEITQPKEQFWTIGNVLAIMGTFLGFSYLFAITFCYIAEDNIQFAQIGEGVVFGSVIGVIYGYQFGASKEKKLQAQTDKSVNTVNVADKIEQPPQDSTEISKSENK